MWTLINMQNHSWSSNTKIYDAMGSVSFNLNQRWCEQYFIQIFKTEMKHWYYVHFNIHFNNIQLSWFLHFKKVLSKSIILDSQPELLLLVNFDRSVFQFCYISIHFAKKQYFQGICEIALCGGQIFISLLTWIDMICKAWWTVYW